MARNLALGGGLVLLLLGALVGTAHAAPSARASAGPKFTKLKPPATALSGSERRIKITVAANKSAALSGSGLKKSVKVGKKARTVSLNVREGAGRLRLPLTLTADKQRTTKTLSIPRSATTAFQAALGGVDRKGHVTPRMALQAFSLAVGRLPDVELPTGPVGQIRSATGPIQWLKANRSRISPAQRKAADKILNSGKKSSSAPGAHASVAEARLQAILSEVRVQESLHLGGPPRQFKGSIPFDVRVTLKTGGLGSDYKALARTDDVRDDQNNLVECAITVGPKGLALGEEESYSTLAHELFHCYQFLVVSNPRNSPPWIAEGGAEWVGDEIAQELLHRPFQETFWWPTALKTPQTPLVKRSYDAVLWFSQLVQAGVNPFPLLLPALRTAELSFDGAYRQLTGGSGDALQRLWAPSYYMEPALGRPGPTGISDWTIVGPGLGGQKSPKPRNVVLKPEKPEPFSASAFASGHADLSAGNPNFDVVEISVKGGRAHINDGFVDHSLLTGEHAFCVADKGCANIPKNCTKKPPSGDLKHAIKFAYGGPEATNVTVEGMTLEEHCGNKAFSPGFACWVVPDGDIAGVIGGEVHVPIATVFPKAFLYPEGVGSNCNREVGDSPETSIEVLDVHNLSVASRRDYRKGMERQGGLIKGPCDTTSYHDVGGGPSYMLCLTRDHVVNIGSNKASKGQLLELTRRADQRIRGL